MALTLVAVHGGRIQIRDALAIDLLDGAVPPIEARGFSRAVVAEPAPNEIITGNTRKAAVLDPIGILASDLTASNRNALYDLVGLHASSQVPALAAERLARIKAAGLEKIRFAWLGSITREPGKAHYYRIQGPTFLLEFDNSRNGGTHIHSVWRDFDADFGQQLQ